MTDEEIIEIARSTLEGGMHVRIDSEPEGVIAFGRAILAHRGELREAAEEVLINHAVADSDPDYCIVHHKRLRRLAQALTALETGAKI